MSERKNQSTMMVQFVIDSMYVEDIARVQMILNHDTDWITMASKEIFETLHYLVDVVNGGHPQDVIDISWRKPAGNGE